MQSIVAPIKIVSYHSSKYVQSIIYILALRTVIYVSFRVCPS